MNTKHKILLIGLIFLGVGALIIGGMKLLKPPTTGTTTPTPTAVGNLDNVAVTEHQAEGTAPSVDQDTSTIPPPPTPTPTEGEMAAAEVGKAYEAYQVTEDECYEAVLNEELRACVAPDDIQRITRPEWEMLLPDTVFYKIGLVGYVYTTELGVERSYRYELVARKDDQSYSVETFEQLLEVNGINTITDENRELIAKSLALMTIPDYLDKEIIFTNWEAIDIHWYFDISYNYRLTAWTEIQGLVIQWSYVFYDGDLLASDGYVAEQNVDDYVEVPHEILHPPTQESMSYRKK